MGEIIKKIMAKESKIEDFKQLRHFLDMENAGSCSGIFVSQRKYALDLLKERRLLSGKLVDIPIDLNQKLGQESSSSMANKGHHQQLVGKLIYVVSQFMHSPTEEYFEVVYWKKGSCKFKPTLILIEQIILRIEYQHLGIVCLLEVN